MLGGNNVRKIGFSASDERKSWISGPFAYLYCMQKIPFSPPKINQAVIDEVTDALRSGWITTGPKTKALEKRVAEMVEVSRVLCVNSATGGMELMLRWLGVTAGDEVIVPAYTYCATANVVLHCGATPIMVDVKTDDLTLDVEQVAKAITERTKAIIPVDLGGMPADYTVLMNLVRQPEVTARFQAKNERQAQLGRILVMADAAHSIGASYQGRPAAVQPDLAVFSFHAVKNLTTAEGGAICLNLPDSFDVEAVYKTLNTTSLHGQNKDALAKFGKNAWEYDVVEAGYKFNMPDVLAAIGLAEIPYYKTETLPRRRAIFDAYQATFANCEWAELPVYENTEKCSSYHLYLLRIRDISLEMRNEIIERIFAAGVSVNVHYKPLPLLTVYAQLGYRMQDYPVACDAFCREITLPVYYDLGDSAVARVAEVVKSAVEAVRTSNTLPLYKKQSSC